MNSVHDTVIHSIYLAYYGRPAAPAGLAFWSEQLTRADGRADAIIEVFANAPEATIRFADTSIAGRVTDVYRQLFDRAPDADGLHFWVDAIESGRTTLAAATLRMLDGARGATRSWSPHACRRRRLSRRQSLLAPPITLATHRSRPRAR